MKKIILALILCAPAAAFAKDTTSTFNVKGWHCGGCSSKTEKAVKKIEGVKSASADDDKGTLVVAYDDSKTNEKALMDAVKQVGYEATPTKAAPAPKKN